MTVPRIFRLVKTGLPALFLMLSACVQNRAELVSYTPTASPSGSLYMQAPFVVAPLADHRFRLYSYAATTMGDTIGWGQGTGTIFTPQNIPDHVTKALVSQFRSDGMNVDYAPTLHCHFRESPDHPQVRVTGTPRRGLVLCGSILDYQFQLDHPRINFAGMISTLDMNAGATLSTQASLHLWLVDTRSGRIVWTGVETSAREKDGLHPPGLKEQSIAFLDGTLSRAIEKVALAISRARE
ncbi:MAG: hypothetical protein M0Z25_06075 [Nitrospiraceae bacterium]|nr:hypothetical protein [Nitrospiraceae bacterium]